MPSCSSRPVRSRPGRRPLPAARELRVFISPTWRASRVSSRRPAQPRGFRIRAVPEDHDGRGPRRHPGCPGRGGHQDHGGGLARQRSLHPARGARTRAPLIRAGPRPLGMMRVSRADSTPPSSSATTLRSTSGGRARAHDLGATVLRPSGSRPPRHEGLVNAAVAGISACRGVLSGATARSRRYSGRWTAARRAWPSSGPSATTRGQPLARSRPREDRGGRARGAPPRGTARPFVSRSRCGSRSPSRHDQRRGTRFLPMWSAWTARPSASWAAT